MKFSVKSQNPFQLKADAFIVPCVQEKRCLTAFADEITAEVYEQLWGDFEGKLFETRVFYTGGKYPFRKIIFVGLGKEAEIDAEKIRGAFSRAFQLARSLRVKTAVVDFSHDFKNLDFLKVGVSAVEGAILGQYRFLPYKTEKDANLGDVEEIIVAEPKRERAKALKARLDETQIICESVFFARDLISTPANDMTPTVLAKKAKAVAKDSKNVSCRVLGRKEIEKLGMNAFLGVAKGSHEPPCFIILEYWGAKKSTPPVVFVGKGLTFDSGGISLKPAEKMEEMKSDMSGAAAVIGTIKAVAALRWPVNCVGLIAATENLPGGSALKPGDVLKSHSGKTIEVINTDAEGRLTLADALSYATKYKPAAIVDIATLTGACIVALGEGLIGLMGNHEELKKQIKAAAEETGEYVWELPLWEPYEEQIKSDIADVKNTGGRPAGTITAALFLRKFVGDYPWAHLDIAGCAWQNKDRPYIPKGAAGIGVRLLVQFLKCRNSSK
ncbi:MAG TPA: leucyl aminopeptidase [Syntrophales bacterium]|nr:leucyl aminopeptidase [Syntrophales bacterium]HOL58563.1 leucyl aminopeptidase [Syntrophales bacterium]HPO34829.1 leucyl aminopeptidase [Syntrophales bacterium]